MRYQLDVFAMSVADAVRRAGGLICDRSLAGWRVSVRTEESATARALTILGATVSSAAATVSSAAPLGGWPRAKDPVRYTVVALDEPSVAAPPPAVENAPFDLSLEALPYGTPDPNALTDLLYPVRHRLSSAAQAFKAQALRSVGLTACVEPWETFWAANVVDPGLAAPPSRTLVKESPGG